MRAVTCTDTVLEVAELPDPVPERGQLLLRVSRCGICGSDLHARSHADELADTGRAVGYDHLFRSSDTVVLGHEFVGEVVGRGPGTKGPADGTRTVALPVRRRDGVAHLTGLSPLAPGAYAELVVVEDALAFAVPDGLPDEQAALTEPLAVALHAVNRGEVGRGQVAIVVGCGPVGLAVIAVLKAKGVRTVVASDPSPGRRALARTVGADVVVDPTTDSPFAGDHGWVTQLGASITEGVGAMGRLRSIPVVPWEVVFRLAQAAGATTPRFPVVFECVGVPGMIDRLVTDAPQGTRVVVVGVCMQSDAITPGTAINKQLELRFVLGYSPLELRDALHLLADGKVDGRPLVTATVGLDGVAGAFEALRDPEAHAKILVDPASAATV